MMMKDIIMEVARDLFIQKGYNATSMGEVVKQSNSSKGTLYYHFTNKEALFLEILNEEENQLFSFWEKEREKCTTNYERFQRFAELASLDEFPYPLRLAVSEFYLIEHETELINAKMREIDLRYVKTYKEILQAGNEEQEWLIEDIETISEIASATFLGLDIFGHHTDQQKRKFLLERYIHLFIKGCNTLDK
ncbi:TetR/AcrR family transcriptional regulator [Alkalihalobacillus pseudalcaliphilus]|uniref:TetR/AcrR family transcriptional regulator n=1 Tax=Alkalihalobacillus pseudalcaliphilus TaxID=79884 RepID=UPI00235EF6A0|nr:TetR/AcrR family transcriptional regulator [Alkalihalobacillus pseudalcaliphilus]